MVKRSVFPVFVCVLFLAVTACQPTIPPEALQLAPDTLERRQLQTRFFETKDEAQLLSASAGLLQDLGYSLDESEVELGVIVASKNRDAREIGQEVAAAIFAVLTGTVTATDKEQKIRASLITRPIEERGGYSVRLTIQRIIWNTDGLISRIEGINVPEIYEEFFDKLGKSVFLEAQEL